jgi:hypothetical protein
VIPLTQRCDIWRMLPKPGGAPGKQLAVWRHQVPCLIEPISDFDGLPGFARESTHIAFVPRHLVGVRRGRAAHSAAASTQRPAVQHRTPSTASGRGGSRSRTSSCSSRRRPDAHDPRGGRGRVLASRSSGSRLALEDLAPELIAASDVIYEHTRQNFETRGDGGWPPLAESTVQRKTSQGYAEPDRPLYAEGNLFESATSPRALQLPVRQPAPARRRRRLGERRRPDRADPLGGNLDAGGHIPPARSTRRRRARGAARRGPARGDRARGGARMIDVLDALADYLATDPHNDRARARSRGSSATRRCRSPTTLPFGYIIPFNDAIAPGPGRPVRQLERQRHARDHACRC